jgi:hypothetical protein
MDEIIVEEEERKGFGSWIRSIFGKKEGEEEQEEAPEYKRRLFDGRIEKYLDQNLDAYISEYGIVTGLDLEVYEERYGKLTGRVKSMTEYMMDAEATTSHMEGELAMIEKGPKSPKK